MLFQEEYNKIVIDINKQVAHWRESAAEDWQVANELVKAGRLRHGLFFAHLALEKILKAHICQKTDELAPRIHNLVRLAEIASLELTSLQIDILAETNTFNVEGRYPDSTFPLPSLEEAHVYLNRAAEIYQWLASQLP